MAIIILLNTSLMLSFISIINYRNLKKVELELGPGINYLVQENGFGKTNFLEAIYFSIFRKSFRPMSRANQLIGGDYNFTKVEGHWDASILEAVVTDSQRLEKRFKLNSKAATFSSVLKKFSLILFAPHSVDLVNGEPQVRRSDLDDFLSNLKPEYSDLIGKYKVVLKNRNAVIRMISENKAQRNQLQFWTEELAKTGSKIFEIRNLFFEEIANFINATALEVYHDLADLSLDYLPNINNEPGASAYETYLAKYSQNLEKEIIVGKSLYGVHKDDYCFSYSKDKNLKYHGSRGQQRIGSFIFKMAQLKILKLQSRENLILLIDDVFSELDEKHRKNIANFLLKTGDQILITGADINEFPQTLTKIAQKIEF